MTVVGVMMIRIARMMSIQTQAGHPQHTAKQQGQPQSFLPPTPKVRLAIFSQNL